jgi:hypothetical protein
MAEDDKCEVERIVERLEAEGWKEQMAGMTYINGTLGTNLLKDGVVITVQQEFFPDEDFIEQEWPRRESEDDEVTADGPE